MEIFRASHLSSFLCFILFLLCASMALAQVAGTREYNNATHQVTFYDGSHWYNFGAGIVLGACSKEAEIEYDPIISVSFKYCNGGSWIKILGTPTLSSCTKAGALEFDGSTYLVCNGLVWVDVRGTLSS